MNPEHLANEANRLKNDAVLNLAFDTVKAEALDALAKVEADNPTAILRHQAMVAAVEEIRSHLDRYILRVEAEQDGASPYA